MSSGGDVIWLGVKHCAMWQCKSDPIVCRRSREGIWYNLCYPCFLNLEKWS